jgi:peptide/nickel transport system substrate-binding protein/oligopeptide transport system substrate-binding protein
MLTCFTPIFGASFLFLQNKEKSRMQSGKKLTLGILPTFLCLLSMLIVACGGSGGSGGSGGTTQAQKAPDNKQVYVDPGAVAGLSDIKTWDPALVTDTASTFAVQNVFTGLVELDQNLNVKGVLAQSYSVGPDGVTWTFKLKPNLKFSNGSPLTSQDVVYSLNRALTPATKSGTAGAYLSLVKDSDKMLAGKVKTLIGDSLLAPDPNTVVIVTNAKAAYFLDALTYTDAYVVNQKVLGSGKVTDNLTGTSGIGAGPWIVNKYARGQEIDFTPNPNYFGAKPQLKELRVPFYKDQNTLYKAYQTGEVDLTGVPSAQLAAAKQLTNEYHNVPQLSEFYYTMNYLVKPFDNIKVRQAFALAVNKDEIAHSVYKDTVVATNHIVPKGMPGYFDALKGPDGTTKTSGNPTLAKQLLTQGLQEDGMTLASLPTITIYCASSGSADIRNEFAAVQQMWQSVLGVKINIRDEDFNQLLSDSTNAANNPKGIAFWWLGWIADYPDPQDWTSLQFNKGVPNNSYNYGQNGSADASVQQQTQQLLTTADSNTNTTQRLQQYNTAEQQLVNDVAWIPMYQTAGQLLRKPCIVGASDNAEGLIYPDAWANIYKSTDSNCSNATVSANG